jgi:iron complex transport system ATP-binding protein
MTAIGAPRGALEARAISTGYGDRLVLDDLSVAIAAGGITALVGPNACGKSTLLRAMGRLLGLRAGDVLIDGADVHRMPTRELARRLGILPQAPVAPESITVGDLVWRGRHPHQRFGTGLRRGGTTADREAVLDALLATGVEELIERRVDSLSGGQRQRVWISLALAQQTPYLLLDEPTTYLDIAHQVEILDLLVDLNRERGTTVLLVSHDLNQAARYADTLVALVDGVVAAHGRPADVLTPALVERVFGMRAVVAPHPVTGAPFVYPLGRHD